MELQETLNSQKIIGEKKKVGGLNFWFQNFLQSNSNKAVWYSHKDKHTDQWNRMKSPEVNPYHYG